MIWEGFDAAGIEVPQQTEADRLALDIAVHVGTLLAVCIYSWREIGRMFMGIIRLFKGRFDPGARLALYIVIGTIPLGLVGFFFKDTVTNHLHGNLAIVGWTTLGFGILLFFGDRFGMTVRRVEHMTVASTLLIGVSQVLALIPGTSRSGITMTLARFLGFEREAAARFSLLLAIPAIAAAGGLLGLDLYESQNLELGKDALAAAVLSLVTALIAITLMIRWLRRASFTPFVVYRILVGGLLLYLVYFGGLSGT